MQEGGSTSRHAQNKNGPLDFNIAITVEKYLVTEKPDPMYQVEQKASTPDQNKEGKGDPYSSPARASDVTNKLYQKVKLPAKAYQERFEHRSTVSGNSDGRYRFNFQVDFGAYFLEARELQQFADATAGTSR